MNSLIGILLLFELLLGCSTTYDFQTKPNGAKLYVGDKLIGLTPLEFSSDVSSEADAGGILIRAEYDGYQSIYIWLPQDGRSHRLTFNLTPFFRRAKDESVVGDLDVQRSDLYQVTEKLLLLQLNLLTNPKPPDDAMDAEIRRIMESNPTMGSMYFLESIRHLRQGNLEQGRESLKKALRFAPSEFDFLALYNELEGKINENKITKK